MKKLILVLYQVLYQISLVVSEKTIGMFFDSAGTENRNLKYQANVKTAQQS
jgi:hypothetical protein